MTNEGRKILDYSSPRNEILIKVTCRTCLESKEIKTTLSGFREWLGGKPIQHTLPDLTDSERELLISSICGSCFDKMFG